MKDLLNRMYPRQSADKDNATGMGDEQAMKGLITNPTKKQFLRFLIPSLIGVFIFLFPVWYQDNLNIPLGVVSDIIAKAIKPFAPTFILLIVAVSAILTVICSFVIPKKVKEGSLIHSLFVASPVYTIIRVVGAIITIMVYFKTGTEYVYNPDTGGSMIGLMCTLVAWFFAASFLIPLLLEYGIMDYTGTLIRGVLKPLFRLPGRSAVDLLASWIGNCNVGVVLTTQQYEQGFYTAREAAIISTCFSAVSLPFCLVIAAMLGVDKYFLQFYLILTITGIVSVMIMARIWPLGTMKNEYYEKVGKQIDEVEPTHVKKTQWALYQAVTRAQDGPTFAQLMKKGIDMFLGIIFTLVPVTMCVGTIALIISTYTPVFDWISLPFKYMYELLGVQEAAAAAPGAVVGFADMFIPAIIGGATITSLETKFIVGILSLVQIIYMSEVGSIIIASKLPVGMGKLIIIFLEKTVISIPIIVLLTKLLVNF